MWWRRRRERELADARAEALHWYERLGGQLTNLPTGDESAVKQAMIDASERYTAAGAQLERSQSPRQFQLARETALEGLAYIRAARMAMGFDPGPELPPLAGQRGVGALTKDHEVEVQGHRYRASPAPGDDTPYYYPGGRVQGRPIPSGWYSEPWWRTALIAGAGTFGSLLLFDALVGGFNDGGFDVGYADGFSDGADYAADRGGDGGGYDAAGDSGGDYGGGDFGGGDYGGGDFGGF